MSLATTECSANEGAEMETLLRRLTTEESNVRAQIFIFISNLHVKSYIKEQLLQSFGVPFSMEDYRKQSSWHKDFSFSDLAPVEGELDLISVSDSIRFSLLIKEQDLQQLSTFIQDKNMTSRSVLDGVSILSNLLKMEQQLDVGWLKSFIDMGLQPTIADLRTAIDQGYSAEVIMFLVDKSVSHKDKIWYQDYVKFNMLTYAASKGQYEVALQLYTKYGVALSVEHDYTVLDFINYSAVSSDVYAAELIEIALEEKVKPYSSQTQFAIKNYLKGAGLSHLSEQSGYIFVSTKDVTINDIEDPKFTLEKRQRFNQLIDRIFELQDEINLLTNSLKHCTVKNASMTSYSDADTNSNSVNQQSIATRKIPNTKDSIQQATPEDAVLIKEVAFAMEEAESGNFEGALAIIDRIANQTGDETLYTGFISIAANANYPIEVIDRALNKGGDLQKNTIFTFIANSNLDGIELYKRYHSIHSVKDLKGRTPLEFALQRKSNENVISKLK